MKGNERQTKKSLSLNELASELRDTEDKLFKLRIKHRVTPLASPAELRTLRRHAARLRTWLQQKQENDRNG